MEKQIKRSIDKKKARSKGLEKKQKFFNIFRTDSESSKRLVVLEETTEKSKTDIMKDALKLSHNAQLIQTTIGRMFPVIKKEFGNVKIDSMNLGARKEKGDMEKIPPDLTFNEINIHFELLDHKFKIEDDDVYSLLDELIVEIEIEGIRTGKFEIIKPILGGSLNKIDINLFKSFHEIANKNKINLKSEPLNKEKTQFAFTFERFTDLEGKWVEPFIKDMILLKSAVKMIEENKLFTEEESKKEV